ncbi:MAG: hypothetical protein IJ496_09980 [Ruminococcus sp.]|nr:hypothetical protein [Ruminococcus sp.]
MKNILCKSSSVIVNLIEGAAAILAVAVIYSFIFESNNKDHDVGLGVFVLLIWLLVLLIPNLFFKFKGKFCIKDVAIFQFVPFLLGAALFTVYQLVLR